MRFRFIPWPAGLIACGPRLAAALTVASLLPGIPPADAATRYWSADGSTPGGDGTWNTTTANRWASSAAGPWTLAWNNANKDIAENSSATANITLGSNITLGGFTQKAGGSSTANSIEQGSGPFTLTLGTSGENPFLAAANSTTGRFLIVNAPIAGGPGNHLVIAGPSTSGTGIITLGRANTFSGETRFSAGATGGARAVLKHPLALQNSTAVLSADASLVFDSSVNPAAFTFGGLAASSAGTGHNLTLQNSAGTAVTLTVGGNHQSTTYRGVLSGSGSLTKTGNGTLVLAGASTHGGPTTVNAGTLQVDGSLASPLTVGGGATLAGGGTVNASVQMNAGSSWIAGDDPLGVSSLNFSGTATLVVTTPLSRWTSDAAIGVTQALTAGGGDASVTINLPQEMGFNGTYRLIRFGSGPADARAFQLGTTPALAWNQTGTLQIIGNHLAYVVAAAGDTSPPVLLTRTPANNASGLPGSVTLALEFNETVAAGTGSIELRRSSDGSLVESFDAATSQRVTFNSGRATIQPSAALPAGQYYVLIPAGAIRDSSGNGFTGFTTNTAWRFTVTAPPTLFTDTGSPTNPPWSEILPTLNVESNDPGPVLGSVINVNNAAVETGLYGNRPISVGSQRIHVACNTSTSNFANFTRWFQTDGNTHVLRVFVDDENTATSREGTSSHTEAFMAGGWNHTDGMTYEWTGRFTMARLLQGFAAFQLKNTDNDWAVQLTMSGSGILTVNNRLGSDVVVTGPDGSPKNFNGGGFDVRVLDDGLNYKLWIDGELYASSSYSRPSGVTTFRWGMYFGAGNLDPPADYNVVLVSGAQIRSWPGTLDTTVSAVTKANNSNNLDSGASWSGGTAPGIHQQALWNSTVGSANTTATLAAERHWAGLKITNPGATVTLDGSATLGLEGAGIDMSTATRDLVVNVPLLQAVATPWNVASGRTATFNGAIRGYPGLTLNGGGTVRLEAANRYPGDTVVNAGTLVANDNAALSGGRLLLQGGNLANSASSTLPNEVSFSSNASVDVAASQTLTLSGPLAGTGTLTKTGPGTLVLSAANPRTGATAVNAGTLALSHPAALLPTPGITLAAGSLLQPRIDGVIVRAPVTLGSGAAPVTISAPTNAAGGGVLSTLTLRGPLSGGGDVVFTSSVNQNASSTVYLGAPCTYTGSTLLNTTASTDGTTTNGEQQIILKLGTHDALPPSTEVTIDGGNGSGTGRYAEINLNGFNQRLAGLTNIVRTGDKAALRRQRVVNSNVSAYSTLTIDGSASFTYSGFLGSNSANGSVSTTAMPGSLNGNHFGLTKAGTGTFSLTGPVTYLGDTTVLGGTLSLGSANSGNQSSTVTIAPGARLHLAFAGTDTVNRLVAGGIPQPPGLYGHGSTGADNGGQGPGALDAFFTAGTGTLQVTAGPPGPFAEWIAGSFPAGSVPAGQRGPDDDPDRDGVPNLLEYALAGRDPNRPEGSPASLDGTLLRFLKRPGVTGLVYSIQESSDLGSLDPWEEVGSYVENNTTAISHAFIPGSPLRKFLRLQVQSP